MILADKIITLRKKAGWSQEELASQLGVTRQSVSKWEGAQSVPDLDKVVQMSRLFGVSTDYLLKDELEEEEFVESEADETPLRRVTMEQAARYLALRKACAPKIALAVAMCIVSPVVIIFLAALADAGLGGISEDLAAGVGVSVILALVAAAVGIFLSCGAKTKEFEFLEKEPFETEYGVSGMVRERRKAYEPTASRCTILGVVLCILAVVPLMLGVGLASSDVAALLVRVAPADVYAAAAVDALLRDHDACLSRIRACRVPVKEKKRKSDVERILYARGQEDAYDPDELYTLFDSLPPEKVSALRQVIREQAWHLMDEDARERFLREWLPEFEDIYDLLTDFRFGGYRILGDIVCDMEDENTGREKKQLFRENDSKAFTAMMRAFADKSPSRSYRGAVTAKCRELLTAIVRPTLAVRYVVALGKRDLLWDLLPEHIEKNVLEVRDD